MGRASFEYDEVGNTFYYVLLSFYALILIPATYFFFPTGKTEEIKVDERECQCNGCQVKRKRKEADKPWKRTKKVISVVGLVVAWAIFAMIVKKVTEIEVVHEEYDPYNILGIDQGSEPSVIKKAYRDLSKKHHPDRGGEAEVFDRIAKAYQALTDDESRENWEKYGNPDGPTATTFGIALPKWLVSKEYGLWVLAFYGVLFMIILPVTVGTWWYNSIKYNVDKVLLDTTQLFYYFLSKTPKMEVNRMIMVLSGSFEFWKQYNKEIVERESDDFELPRLIKLLPALGENKKERPLSLPYALKARILVHCHLSRIPLESEMLEFDQRYVLARVIRLIEEMISLSQQLVFYAQINIPLDTIESMIRLQPMFVQALWPKNSSLLQLPHIGEFNLQHLRRQKIYTCSDLAAMEADKRRAVLKSLTNAEFHDVMVVLSSMPRLSINTTVVVEGEDDAHEVTAGCVVTLKVELSRSRLIDPQVAGLEDFRVNTDRDDIDDASVNSEDEENMENEEGADGETAKGEGEEKKKRKPWEKPQRKKGGKKKGAKQQPKKAAAPVPSVAEPETPATPSTAEKRKKEREEKEERGEGDESDIEAEESVSGSDNRTPDDSSDDEDWHAHSKKPNLEAKSHKTHPVHSPYYPGEKFEWWWVYLTTNDKKAGRRLATHIVSCKTLVDEQTVEIRFPAPSQKGVYNYQLSVRSDSYMDADYSKDIKLDVKETKEIVLPKYEDTSDEEMSEVDSSDEEYTEGSDSD